ncbi:hypothetical protein I7I53_11506 [Histoplasma capsulatum var. duboisii H88]|uniref:Uncharacterized protein n=1 Tax=Ajellomyces capsulatus (strain H88) TaxID=544711 RepID=A0A8A1LDJ4_AJEC8|nr:hypothetical protein I7I53_11506 [Histoplasma capsulatum var. duboisii H88]
MAQRLGLVLGLGLACYAPLSIYLCIYPRRCGGMGWDVCRETDPPPPPPAGTFIPCTSSVAYIDCIALRCVRFSHRRRRCRRVMAAPRAPGNNYDVLSIGLQWKYCGSDGRTGGIGYDTM